MGRADGARRFRPSCPNHRLSHGRAWSRREGDAGASPDPQPQRYRRALVGGDRPVRQCEISRPDPSVLSGARQSRPAPSALQGRAAEPDIQSWRGFCCARSALHRDARDRSRDARRQPGRCRPDSGPDPRHEAPLGRQLQPFRTERRRGSLVRSRARRNADGRADRGPCDGDDRERARKRPDRGDVRER